MFHRHSKKLATIAIGLGLTLLPATSFAQDIIEPNAALAAQTQVNTPVLKDTSIRDVRNGTKEKMFEARVWAKSQKAPQEIKNFINDMEHSTDLLQDKVAPVGHSIKSFANKNMPGKSFARSSDQSFTVYGMLLMMALVFVFTMMNLANPESRLGGRH